MLYGYVVQGPIGREEEDDEDEREEEENEEEWCITDA